MRFWTFFILVIAVPALAGASDWPKFLDANADVYKLSRRLPIPGQRVNAFKIVPSSQGEGIVHFGFIDGDNRWNFRGHLIGKYITVNKNFFVMKYADSHRQESILFDERGLAQIGSSYLATTIPLYKKEIYSLYETTDRHILVRDHRGITHYHFVKLEQPLKLKSGENTDVLYLRSDHVLEFGTTYRTGNWKPLGYKTRWKIDGDFIRLTGPSGIEYVIDSMSGTLYANTQEFISVTGLQSERRATVYVPREPSKFHSCAHIIEQ